MHVASEDNSRVCPLVLLCGSGKPNSNCQAWCQAPVTAEPAGQPRQTCDYPHTIPRAPDKNNKSSKTVSQSIDLSLSNVITEPRNFTES